MIIVYRKTDVSVNMGANTFLDIDPKTSVEMKTQHAGLSENSTKKCKELTTEHFMFQKVQVLL